MDIGRGGFLAGTLVATPKGPQRIERLRVGDLVVTMDTVSEVLQNEKLRAVFLERSASCSRSSWMMVVRLHRRRSADTSLTNTMIWAILVSGWGRDTCVRITM